MARETVVRRVPLATFIIVNFNGRKLLEECLPTLQAQTVRDWECLIVDCGSRDDSLPFLRRNYPSFRVLPLRDDRGYSYGLNIGLKHALGSLLVLMNNDVQLAPDWLERMLEALSRHPEASGFTGKVYLRREPRRLDSAGMSLNRRLQPYNYGHGEEDRGQYEEEREVFGGGGALLMVKREMVEDVGFFDEDFQMYYEDVDFYWRARWAGHRFLYIPKAVAYHWVSATPSSLRSMWRGLRNWLWMVGKNLPLEMVPQVQLVEALSGMAWSAWRQGKGKEFLRGLRTAWAKAPRMLAKRREILRRRRVSCEQMLRWLDEAPHRPRSWMERWFS